MTPADRTPPRLRLHAGHVLLHEEGACLPLRSRHGHCSACAQACPSAALTVTVDAVTLSDACTGCGRCTAACPTQALSLPEVDSLPPASAELATIRFECRKVPAELRAADTAVLPCLGALTPGRLMAHVAAGTAVRVVDRGWCEGCEAGSSASNPAHPAAAAVATARLWLNTVWAQPAALPLSLEREPLPLALRPDTIAPAPEPAPPVDRRRFFRAALDKPAGRERSSPAPMGGDGRAAYPADARQASPERTRQHAALQALAAQGDSSIPAEFFPGLHADARCCDRRMCVALCPTAALTVADDGATARLQFDPLRCIACGTCERACPEGSLQLQPHGGQAGVQTLAGHHRLRCTSCGDAYTAPATGTHGSSADGATSAGLCPVCTKSRRFIDDARRQLFGVPN